MTPRAIVTLHDVAPQTLDDCLHTLDVLRRYEAAPVTLLVIPGTGWTGHGLDTLRELADEGYPLAGHGWSHRAPVPVTTYHRLHGALISRDEGEHLSRSADELRDRVRRAAGWFRKVGLETPSLYVPPAWAMGRLSKADLDALPFRYYETLSGIRDVDAGTFKLFPLVGFQADTLGRAWTLKGLNGFNRAAMRIMRRPLRISIHPPDLRLRLADDIFDLLRRDWRYVTVPDAMRAAARRHGGSGSAEPDGRPGVL